LNEHDVEISRSSGNVFADLNLDKADERLVKADLAAAIIRSIREEKWTQAQAAERLGIAQPDVSNISRGKLDDFSQERLQNLLRRLGIDVEIALYRRANGRTGTLKVLERA
jgi:predicted XRE-type DNA-binding protein